MVSYDSAMSVPVIKATHSTEREYINEKGEKCKDVVIHCSVLELRKKVGDAKAAEIIAATQGKRIAPVPSHQ